MQDISMSENLEVIEDEKSEKRVFIGGLFPTVSEEELQNRFARFGTVKGIEIKIRKDDHGSPIKTFAYVDLEASDADLAKCVSTYNKTKWKGSDLKIQLAKENFMKRLVKEREDTALSERVKPVETAPVSGIQSKLVAISDLTTTANFQMKGAPPGTTIPGEEKWIVGKYGRVLPVVHMKRTGGSKIMKIDPSKLTHNLKKIKDEKYLDCVHTNDLTWQMEEYDTEVTRKRKGEFPDWKSTKVQRKNGDARSEEIQKRLMEVVDSDRIYRISDFEVVRVSKKASTAGSDRKTIGNNSRYDYDSEGDNDDVSEAIVDEFMDLSRFYSDSDNEAFTPVRQKAKLTNLNNLSKNQKGKQNVSKSNTTANKKYPTVMPSTKQLFTENMTRQGPTAETCGIQNFVDEYSSGLNEIEFNKTNPISVERMHKSDSSDDESDFEAFVHREIKILESAKLNSSPYMQGGDVKKPAMSKQSPVSNLTNNYSTKPKMVDFKKTLKVFQGTKFLTSYAQTGARSTDVIKPDKCTFNDNNIDMDSDSDGRNDGAASSTYTNDLVNRNNSSECDDNDSDIDENDDDDSDKNVLILDNEVNQGIRETTAKANITPNLPVEGSMCTSESSESDDDDDTDSDDNDNNLLILDEVNQGIRETTAKANVTLNLPVEGSKCMSESSESDDDDSDSDESDNEVNQSIRETTAKANVTLNMSAEESMCTSESSESDDDVDDDSDKKLLILDNEVNQGIRETTPKANVTANMSTEESISTSENDDDDDDDDDDQYESDSSNDFKTLISKAVKEIQGSGKAFRDSSGSNISNAPAWKDGDSSKQLRKDTNNKPQTVKKSQDNAESSSEHSDSDEESENNEDVVCEVRGSKRIEEPTDKLKMNVNEDNDSSDDDDTDDNSSATETISHKSLTKPKAIEIINNTGIDNIDLDSDSDVSEDNSATNSGGEVEKQKNIKVAGELPRTICEIKRNTVQGTCNMQMLSGSEPKTKNSTGTVNSSVEPGLVVGQKRNDPVIPDHVKITTEKEEKETNEKNDKRESVKANNLKIEDKSEIDKKRLLVVKQRQKENNAHKSAIKNALSNLDKSKTVNTKIVFDSDSEDEQVAMETDEKGSARTSASKEKSTSAEVKESSKTQALFGSDDEEEDDDDDTARFKVRAEFEGEEGRKLAKLQSRFGHDERFKLDARFIESGSESDEEEGKIEEDDEMTRSLKILQSVVGAKAVGAISKQDKSKKKFKDMGTLQYDPSKQEHQQFEVKTVPKDKSETKGKKNKKKKDELDAVEEATVVLPEVSKDKFYEISDGLKDTFMSTTSTETPGGTGFSLLAAFGRVDSDDDEHDDLREDAAIPIPETLRSNQLSLDNRFKVTDDAGDSDSEVEVDKIDSDGEQIKEKEITGSQLQAAPRVNHPAAFFFTRNDKRLKDGETFKNKVNVDTVREKWLEKRQHLIQSYKSKHKNFLRKHKDLQKSSKHYKRGGKRR